jgi:hypothetical protein
MVWAGASVIKVNVFTFPAMPHCPRRVAILSLTGDVSLKDVKKQ